MSEPHEIERAGAGRSNARRTALGAGVAALLALALLAASAGVLDPSRLHLGGNFVDQAGYILTARILLDTGELRSGLLYPAYLDQPDWRLYMPGHYVALATSYAVFGWGVFSSLFPSLLGHVLGTVAVFLTGARLRGRATGFAAAFLFAIFPGTLTYAFTAMAELTLTAACAVALAAFVHVPARRRAYAAPFLLALPFLFRETGALYVLPMLCLLAAPGGRRAWKAAGLALLASVALLVLLNLWQIADGKGRIPLSWVTDSTFNYGDAFPPPPPELSFGEWTERILANGRRNVSQLVLYVRHVPGMAAVAGMIVLLAAILVTLVAGVVRRGRDPIVLGAGLLGLTAASLTFLLYDVTGEKGMRGLIFTTPALALGLGTLLVPDARRGRLRWTLLGALALMAVLGSRHLVGRAGHRMQRFDPTATVSRRLIESIRHDDDEVLVSHFSVAMEYAVYHYPVRVCFVPSNDATLQRVVETFGGIGTLVFPEDFLGSLLSAEAINAAGMTLRGRHPYHDRVLLVFR